jgi:hypothetical protein
MGTARQPRNGQTGRPRNEEQGDVGGAALTAIERVIQMLQEEVLPNLSEGEDPEAIEDPDAMNGGEDVTSDPEEAAFASPLAQRGRVIPCKKGGPSPADEAIAAKIAPKLRGKLRGAMTGGRVCCARRIVDAVKAHRLPHRAAVIAVTTAIVEASLLNVNYGDRDSLGLFQQRASWGSRAQRLNPTWATNAFLNAMLKKYPRGSWKHPPIGTVCQRVQVSAFPGRYQPEVIDARLIVDALWKAGKPRVAALAAPGKVKPRAADEPLLQAIERLSEMLSEEVIPKLSHRNGEEEPYPGGEDTESPGVPEDETPPAEHVPAAVMDAVETVYGTVSEEQARALADLFTAMADAQEGGNDADVPGEEEPPDDESEDTGSGAGGATSTRTREYA